jgi:GTP-binding protein
MPSRGTSLHLPGILLYTCAASLTGNIMHTDKIRNIAIIAHVDHGKTTLVDQLLRQSGSFRDNEVVTERLMDNSDIERERGITISSKNGSFLYAGHTVNIIDTPGHADFGGEVERILQMADGALLLVDAQEGPMPQTYFVLKKALARHLPVVLVVNKIDKPAARARWVVDHVFDLFVTLGAPDRILDFHVVYASARDGHASLDPAHFGTDMRPLFEAILKYIPPPRVPPTLPSSSRWQVLITPRSSVAWGSARSRRDACSRTSP